MELVRSEGVQLACEVTGSGKPVTVLAHGLTSSRHELAIFAPYLPGTNVLFDLRGHGDSERPPPGSYSMDLFAADIDNVAAAFGAGAVAGVSLGAGAALRLLSRMPDRFERLVFLLPARLERSMAAHGQLRRLAELLERKPLDEVADAMIDEERARGEFDEFPAAAEFRRQNILRMNADGMPHAIREALDDPPVEGRERLLERVSAPALVIGQRGDPVHHAEVAEDLASLLPNAELLLFQDRFALLREIPSIVQRVAAFLAG